MADKKAPRLCKKTGCLFVIVAEVFLVLMNVNTEKDVRSEIYRV